MAVMRDANGRLLPGSVNNPNGRPKSGHTLADLIRVEFGKEIEVLLDGNLTKLERRQIMADAMAQLISTGKVKLPDRVDENGKVIRGVTFDFPATEWMKHLIRLFRYIEPPVTNIEVSGGVDGIVFDKEISDEPDE